MKTVSLPAISSEQFRRAVVRVAKQLRHCKKIHARALGATGGATSGELLLWADSKKKTNELKFKSMKRFTAFGKWEASRQSAHSRVKAYG